MSLPTNYKQVAASQASSSNVPNSGGHYHRHSSGGVPFNILKERLRASGSGSERGNKDHGNPFVHTSHGNPAFAPQKVSGKAAAAANADAGGRGPKAPKAPEKPLMPYMRYSRKVWDSVKVNYPEHKLWELGKVIGQMWRDLDDSERQVFVDEHELEMAEYEKAMKTYHSSPAFLAFLAAKSKVKSSDNDSHDTPSRPPKGSQQDRRIDIQPAEDEDDQDEGYSVKHVAYARFLRNHRLVNEIFSDLAVPDVRTVVTSGRMQVLKRQVHSLTMHQMKLEAELTQMEDKFEAKKRKLTHSNEVFQEELIKHCKPAVEEEQFQLMVDRQYQMLKAERMRQLEEPKAAALAAMQRNAKDPADGSNAGATGPAGAATSNAPSCAAGASAAATNEAAVATGAEQEPMETDAPIAEPAAAKAVAATDATASAHPPNAAVAAAVATSASNDSDANANAAAQSGRPKGTPTPDGAAAAAAATPIAAVDSVGPVTSGDLPTAAAKEDAAKGPVNVTAAVPSASAAAVATAPAGPAHHAVTSPPPQQQQPPLPTPQVSAAPKPVGPPSTFGHPIVQPAVAPPPAGPPHVPHAPPPHGPMPVAGAHGPQPPHPMHQPPHQAPHQHGPPHQAPLPPQQQQHQAHAVHPGAPPTMQQQQQQPPPPQHGMPIQHAGHPGAPGMPPQHGVEAVPPPNAIAPPPPVSVHQAPMSAQQHHAQGPPQPPHHAMPTHMAPHQGMPGGHPGMAGHPSYGPFAAPTGPPRSPYYPPQYAGHPAQPPYHQYGAYPYHQQYGPPPPSHYMGQRPPMHYGGGAEHAPPPHAMDGSQAQQQQPPPPPPQQHAGGPYGPPQVVPPPQQQQQPPAPLPSMQASAGAGGVGQQPPAEHGPDEAGKK